MGGAGRVEGSTAALVFSRCCPKLLTFVYLGSPESPKVLLTPQSFWGLACRSSEGRKQRQPRKGSLLPPWSSGWKRSAETLVKGVKRSQRKARSLPCRDLPLPGSVSGHSPRPWSSRHPLLVCRQRRRVDETRDGTKFSQAPELGQPLAAQRQSIGSRDVKAPCPSQQPRQLSLESVRLKI